MSSPLQSASIAAPGFFGLNTQESSVTLAAGFALQADNCVIDKYGRLGARKGWQYITSGSDGVNLEGSHRFVDITGMETILSWSDDSFYKGIATLTEITPTTDNTITAGNWQCATLNDKAYYFQRGYKPMVFDPVAGTITDVEDEATYAGTVPNANAVLSAYGRLWAADTTADKMTLYWSDLLDGSNWGTGSAGSLDLTAILVQGTDEITGIGAQNGQLIIFCRNSVVVFGDTDSDTALDPATIRLVEVINSVGCVARDTIRNTGIDILFLSADGLRSLGRVIQEKSLPMRDLSKNVRDDLVRNVSAETVANIKAVYFVDEAMYLLLLPTFKRVYCFDTRSALQDGSYRVTLWDNQTQVNMLATDNTLYFMQTNGFAEYRGQQDNGNKYTMKYYTNYFDFDNASQVKILKRLAVTLIGGTGQDFVLKTGFDYSDAYNSSPASIQTATNYEYGIAEYGIAEYSTGTLADNIRASLGGSGNVIQVGFEAVIDGAPLSIQKLDIYIKKGRIY
jgi:hypothetical protein